jgi:sugar phosphate permease
LREPARGQSERGAPRAGGANAEEAAPPFLEAAGTLLRSRSYVHLCLAAALFAGVAGNFNIWGIVFMQRVHGLGLAEAGLQFGLATGIPGVFGTLVSGWLADRLAARDRRWSLWIPALGGVAMVPFSVAFVFSTDPQYGLLAYAAQVFLATFWMAPAFSLAQGLAKLRTRATAAAIFLLIINVLGLGLLPALVGAASDALSATHGSDGLRYALLGLSGISLWGVGHILAIARRLDADLAAAASD